MFVPQNYFNASVRLVICLKGKYDLNHFFAAHLVPMAVSIIMLMVLAGMRMAAIIGESEPFAA
jgi:hypothetical protein